MKLSVVIPCRNEADNLAFLLDEVDEAMAGRDYEVLVVDDASGDHTGEILKTRLNIGKPVRYIRHDRYAGQSAAVRSGVFAASGEIVITIDGDGQNNPAYLPKLADALIAAEPDVGLAAGQRLKRTDTKLKQYSSRFANTLRQAILKDNTFDSGCGLKAIYTDLFRQLPFFDGWHRYLPALVLREGWKTTHIDVVDRERVHGKSNYGIFDRGLRGILDLYGVWWLRRRRKTVPKSVEIYKTKHQNAQNSEGSKATYQAHALNTCANVSKNNKDGKIKISPAKALNTKPKKASVNKTATKSAAHQSETQNSKIKESASTHKTQSSHTRKTTTKKETSSQKRRTTKLLDNKDHPQSSSLQKSSSKAK